MRRPPSLLLAVAVAVAAVSGATWRALSSRDALYARSAERLDGIAAGTAAAVNRWLEERRYDAATVADEADSLVAHLSAAPPAEREAARASLRHVLHRLRAGHGYMNAWAIDSAGAALASAAPGEPTDAERAAARRARIGRGGELCDPFALPGGAIAFCYAVAVRDAGGPYQLQAGTRVGSAAGLVIVLRSNPMGSLLPLVTASDLGGSEKTFLMGGSGDSLIIMAVGRATPDRPRIVRRAWRDVPPLARAAVAGRPVSGRFRPFAVGEVIAAARPLGVANWAVVRRVPLSDVQLAFWRQFGIELLVVGLALAAAALAVVSATRAERHRRLRDVAASEGRLAETLRASFDAVIAIDDALRIQLFNAAAERLFGVAASTMLGRPATALFPERLRELHASRFHAFLDSPDGSRSLAGGREHVGLRADGEEFAFEAVVSKGVADGARLSTVMMRDVSERRRAEEERERTLSLLRATLEATADGILVVDGAGQIAASTRRFLEIYGVAEGPLVTDALDDAARWAAMARVRDPDAFRARVAEIYADPAGESHDVVELADGRLIERESKPQRVGERVVGRVWSFRDITERERATAALRQAEKLAAVGQFVSGVAHELNNPLAAVMLFTEQMLEDPRTPDDVETLTLVRDQARRARSIVRDLLAFVRNASGELATVDARELLEQVTHALDRQIAADRGGRVELHAPGPVGTVRVDRAAVEQVVTNLVLNAAQAAPGGVVRVVASAVAATGSGGALAVAVEDDGPGIPAHVLPRVFEPFFTTKPVGVGTGLGLSVSLGIAQRHGGSLRAENRAEGGARVVLTLPLDSAPASAVAAAPAVAPVALAARRRVLLVDDEPPVRRALGRYFARRDWEVEEAEHGGPALERLLDGDADAGFDLIISDLRMSGVSGVALHDRLAAQRPELLDRLVIATGDVASEDAAAFLARTRCAVLEKPFEPSALDAMLRAIVAEEGVRRAGAARLAVSPG